LRYIFGEIMYGGHITDPWDRRVNNTYLTEYVVPDLLNNMNLAAGFRSPDASKMEYAQYVKYIEEKFPPESPGMFGLHPNAEIGYLTNQGNGILSTILQVAGGGGGGGALDLQSVAPTITQLLKELPDNLDMIEIRGRLKDEDYTPYVIVALQESEAMNKLLSAIRSSLQELELGIQGALNVTDKMEALAVALNFNKVYPGWSAMAYPSLKDLAKWFLDLIQRVDQLVTWVSTPKIDLLKTVWISGLFNPMSFMTAVKQVTARSNALPLDYMENRVFITNMQDSNEVANYPAKGVYIYGLFLEGAGWEEGKGEDEGYLTDSKMKDLHPSVPIVNVYALLNTEMTWDCMYHCPVFVTATRGATYVFTANVRMEPDDHENKWTLAGAAMLMTDD
jgi:dynein heavy chain